MEKVIIATEKHWHLIQTLMFDRGAGVCGITNHIIQPELEFYSLTSLEESFLPIWKNQALQAIEKHQGFPSFHDAFNALSDPKSLKHYDHVINIRGVNYFLEPVNEKFPWEINGDPVVGTEPYQKLLKDHLHPEKYFSLSKTEEEAMYDRLESIQQKYHHVLKGIILNWF